MDRLERLQNAADEAGPLSYAPYSGLVVKAAVETADGRVYGGSNVENVNYSLTKHAEEVALLAAISDGVIGRCGEKWIRAVLVVGASPCGSCRQFMNEWASADTEVIVRTEGRTSTFSLSELLPYPFDAGALAP